MGRNKEIFIKEKIVNAGDIVITKDCHDKHITVYEITTGERSSLLLNAISPFDEFGQDLLGCKTGDVVAREGGNPQEVINIPHRESFLQLLSY